MPQDEIILTDEFIEQELEWASQHRNLVRGIEVIHALLIEVKSLRAQLKEKQKNEQTS